MKTWGTIVLYWVLPAWPSIVFPNIKGSYMAFGMKVHTGKILVVLCLCNLCSHNLLAQVDPTRPQTTPSSPADTTQAGQSQSPTGIASVPPDAVEFSSQDSMIIDLSGNKKVFLFGSAKVNHPSGDLSSGEINVDIDQSTFEAATVTPEDTLSQPVLLVDGREIRSKSILFNYETEKGRFEAAQVEVGEGHLIGSRVKNVSRDEVFIQDGIYSTCPPEYLYYYIKAKKMKVVDQDELFFTNARLYILDIPYPLVFPFGYVPTDIEKQRSGLLTPTYAFQQQNERGLGLQNIGWFQYFNDYLTGQLSGDIFTSGAFFLDGNVQYRNQDEYSGSIDLGYSKDRDLEKTDPDYTENVQKRLAVRHSQTISPYASLTANINLRTSNYYTFNSYNVEDRAEASSRSSISYNYKQPENLFNFSTDARLVQNFSQNTTTLAGPRASFNLKNISPFQNDAGSGEQVWYNTINLSYSNELETEFEYAPDDSSTEITFFEALTDPALYREATGNNDYIQAGFQQRAGLTVGQLIPSRFLNISGSINYNEYWYPSSVRKYYDPELGRAVERKVPGFVTARDFSTGLSFSTTLYGTSLKKIGPVEGFRHTMRPNISFSYRPDFGDESWGYYRTVQSDSLGNTQRYSIFENSIISRPSSGEQRVVTFSLRNVLETKIVKRDSTGEVKENNLRIIDNLSLSTSYNFAADSLKLSDLSTSFSSNAIPGISISGRANFSFYQLNDSTGREINRFFIEDGKKLAQLQNFSVSASTSFRGGGRGVEVFTPVYRRRYDPFNQAAFSPIDPHFGYEPVSPVNSPWSVSFDFSYSWSYRFNREPVKRAEINATNISFNLTPKWKFSTRIGYDFIGKELTPSRFNLSRNLECWDLSFVLSPFGESQFYFFRLSVNSSQIQTLFQKLPVLKNLERSSTPTGRGRY